MKRFVVVFLLLTAMTYCHAQLEKIVVEKVYSTSAGNTYHVFAQLKNEGDKVLAVFGDSSNVLKIESTKPFYQNRYGGSLSSNVRKNMLEIRDSLKYDSWLTIGRTDNYDNNLKTLGLSLTEFENKGGKIVCSDGAWYCLPIDKQSVSDEKKRIVLMQLTTHGEINGVISIMGKTVGGDNFQEKSIHFKSN